jgi:membrane-bound lytic murein transglycosylase A
VSRQRLATGLAALLLSACATTPLREPDREVSSMARLPGWAAEDHAAALAAVRYACRTAPPSGGRGRPCTDAVAAGGLGEDAARTFLERHYRAEPVDGAGLLTGYFSPAYEARSAPQGEFTAPVRPTPQYDQAGPERAAIERTPAPDALAWMRPEDLFFLQVQGSGVLTFADGARRRAIFAGSNGLRFVAIAKAMIAQGLIAPADASAGKVHDWLAAHRGDTAKAVMDQDPRYIYFRLVRDDGGEPQGASGAPLVPGRSLAVDPAYHRYFELLWVDGEDGRLTGARPSYQRLAVALDRGGAITGPVRADLYVGSGAAAGDEAARVGHRLRLYRIVPAQP